MVKKTTTTDDTKDKFDIMDERREVEYYLPPSQLEFTPELKDKFGEMGMVLKWVRFRTGDGNLDTTSIRKRTHPAEGYTFVTPEDLTAMELMTLGDVEQFSGNGVITNGDLVLMKVRREKAEARKAYYERATKEKSDATKQMLRQNEISNNSSSTVRTGKSAHFSG